MSSGDERLGLVEQGWNAYQSGDLVAFLALVHPDIEVVSPPDMGNPGTFRGHEGLVEWMSEWFEAWDEFEQELLSVEAVGSRSVVQAVRQTARGRSTGIEIARDIAYVYEIRDEKLAYLALQADLEQARAHALERETAGSSV